MENENQKDIESKEVLEQEKDGELQTKDDSVSYDSYKKLLGQRKKDQESIREMQTRLVEFERKEQEAEEAKMVEEGEHKKLLEIREKEISRLKEERDEAQNQLIEGIKLQSFLNMLPGKLKDKAYLVHVDLDRIAIDPSTGVVDDSSVKDLADEFMKSHGVLVDAKQAGPKLPTDAPREGQGKALSIEQWKKLPFEERKKRMADVKFS